MNKKNFKIAVICGGPSEERGISLNSARSILDQLSSNDFEIIPLYVDYQKKFFRLSKAQLYSNTPSDFDFKLHETAILLNEETLEKELKEIDLVFPAIHGNYGEGGELQTLLEKLNIPFVGSSSLSCKAMFNKYNANHILKAEKYSTIPTLLIEKNSIENEKNIDLFFKSLKLKKAIVKPVAAGSSIGVFFVTNKEEILEKAEYIFDKNIDDAVILEPFIQGKEFTILILENFNGEPIPLIPTHIEIKDSENYIFDYRKKYLPSSNTFYHTPANFSNQNIDKIRLQAKKLFKLFDMHDFVRIDGWLMPNGDIYFTDFNPIVGLEQNSFIFRQASCVGLTHRQVLEYIVKSACRRNHLNFPKTKKLSDKKKKNVFVLFGGRTAERQVSLMSGTNVWLKLLNSKIYQPKSFFLDINDDIWEIPYSYALNHTTEEIYLNCINTKKHYKKTLVYINLIQKELDISKISSLDFKEKVPSFNLKDFATMAQKENAFIFLALHGGHGEDGTLQNFFEQKNLFHNGSKAKASKLCIDKYLTRKKINKIVHPSIYALNQAIIRISILKDFSTKDFKNFWKKFCHKTQYQRFIIKPKKDGCSAGIALLSSSEELEKYVQYVKSKATFIPKNTFSEQYEIIELSINMDSFLLEPFIEVDHILVKNNQLIYQKKEGWIELTIGILEDKKNYHSFYPSLTIAEGSILSLEEKFQGGTGINITPPPTQILPNASCKKIQKLIEEIAEILNIENYARIDIFYNLFSQKVIIIEVNTLPALTPSTVIYHQALMEIPSLTPIKFLEKIIINAWK